MRIKENAEKFLDALEEYAHQRIYTFGNGGSASIADHMACDWMKGTGGKLRVISLSSNNALISAIGNDLGYSQTCVAQLKWLARDKDMLVLISSSGNSPNVINAAAWAKEQGMCVVGFTGFSGGMLKNMCDVSIHIDADDYGTSEDFHSNVMHEITRMLR